MIELLLAWAVAPAVLLLLCTGAGLLIGEVVAGIRLGWLTAPVGAAVLIVVSTALTLTSVLAPAATALSAVLAATGWVVWLVRRAHRPRPGAVARSWGPAAAGLLAFAAFAAPVVLSGTPTWAGWLKLDDGASWLAFTDYVLSAGHTLPSPMASSYDALIHVNFGPSGAWGWFGYPRGTFPPLGAMAAFTGLDAAWVMQPYTAVLAGLLAVVLYVVVLSLVRRRWLAVTAAAGSTLAATLYGYAMWGGIKEVLLALLTALLCATTAVALGRRLRPRLLCYPGVVAAAVVATTGTSGVGLVALVAVGGGLVLWWQRQPRTAILVASALAGGGAMVALLAWRGLLGSGHAFGAAFPDMGNLVGPLNPFQAVGIWPAADFRFEPDAPVLTGALVLVAVVLAVLGVADALRQREWAVPMLTVTNALLVLYGQYTGDAWLGGKVIASASPAILVASFAGAVSGWRLLRRSGRPALVRLATPVAATCVGAVLFGVLWSDALAYHGVWLAPQERLAEAERIGERFAGQGPALLTATDVYASRHFLRALGAEGASDLRVHTVPLRDGTSLDKGQTADVDAFAPATLADYPLLVLRRTPLTSRPPANYELVWSGQYYEVWQRNPALGTVVDSIAVGTLGQPVGVPECTQIVDLAERTGTALVAAEREAVVMAPVPVVEPGQIATVPVTVDRDATYELWLGGSFPGALEVRVDGTPVYVGGSVVEGDGTAVTSLGTTALTAGAHTVQLRHTTPWLRPGSGAGPFPIGPLYLAEQDAADAALVTVPAAEAERLCGRTLDWVQAVSD